jgi:hypothetical protein
MEKKLMQSQKIVAGKESPPETRIKSAPTTKVHMCVNEKIDGELDSDTFRANKIESIQISPNTNKKDSKRKVIEDYSYLKPR